jgi:hypothetical protein
LHGSGYLAANARSTRPRIKSASDQGRFQGHLHPAEVALAIRLGRNLHVPLWPLIKRKAVSRPSRASQPAH